MMKLNKEGLRKRLRKSQWERVLPEIRSVSTIDLAFKAENVLEKLIWLILGMLGIVWASYFVGLIIEDENPIVTVRGVASSKSQGGQKARFAPNFQRIHFLLHFYVTIFWIFQSQGGQLTSLTPQLRRPWSQLKRT